MVFVDSFITSTPNQPFCFSSIFKAQAFIFMEPEKAQFLAFMENPVDIVSYTRVKLHHSSNSNSNNISKIDAERYACIQRHLHRSTVRQRIQQLVQHWAPAFGNNPRHRFRCHRSRGECLAYPFCQTFRLTLPSLPPVSKQRCLYNWPGLCL